MVTKTKKPPKTQQEGTKLTARDVLRLKTAELQHANALAAMNEARAFMENTQLSILARLKIGMGEYSFRDDDEGNVYLIPAPKDDNGRA